MNKRELIARVQRLMGPGATRQAATASVEAVLGGIRALTAEGEPLHLAHFGTFERVTRAARTGYDINTATRRTIPAKSVLTFQAAKSLTEGRG